MLGLLAAAAAIACLPAAGFEAHAIVGLDDAGAMVRLAMVQAGTEAVVSRPVMTRAAASLIGTSMPIPKPAIGERVAVAAGLGGARATSGEARLVAALSSSVAAVPGQVPGTLAISATDADAERAARVASAVAEAFVAEEGDHAAETLRADEDAATARLDGLRAAAVAAHRRFELLGGTILDPAQARAAAAARTDAARTRLETIRAIIASGSPPFSDRRDVPSSIEVLQNVYLDQTRQLAKARETLGDRHMTVISLQEGARRAAAGLAAEWKRLARLAESDWADARDREASLRKADTPADASRRAAIDAARAAAQTADEAVARADAARRAPRAEPRFLLLARAAVPSPAIGLSAPSRVALAALAGLLVAALVLLLGRRREASVPAPVEADHAPEPVKIDPAVPMFFSPEEPEAPDVPGAAIRHSMRSATMIKPSRVGPLPHETEPALLAAMQDILPAIDAVASQFGVPFVMVAANEVAAGTFAVGLALGRAAAAAGLRVLLVESPRPRPEMAAAADPSAEPILVDILGSLRVALRAEGDEGFFYLAPSFRDGSRIASALARGGETPFVDDLADAFDLVVIDGGQATEGNAADAFADLFLRVGRFASQRDDERFLAAFEATRDAFIGTIVASVFLPKQAARPAARPHLVAEPPVRRPTAATPSRVARRPAPVQSTARRKVGLR